MSDKQLLPIGVATLTATDSVAWDLFLLPRGSSEHILYRAAGHPLAAADLDRLLGSDVSKLYIAREHRASFQKHLRESASVWLANGAAPSVDRMEALNHLVSNSLNDAFRKRQPTKQLVAETLAFGQQTAAFLQTETLLFGDLVRVLQHDYTTFAHSANVCFYSVLLAKALGIRGDDLAHIATGALLHDIGKLEIDERLLVKDNRLSEAERREMQKHTTLGFRRLCQQSELSAAQLMMTYQHHERPDGAGYPVGLAGAEIHPWAKLCCVVDVFDALTSDRPYRPAIADDVALQIMHRDGAASFETEMLACWTQLISTSAVN